MKKLLILFFVALVTPAFSQIYERISNYHDGLALASGYTSTNGYSKKYGFVDEYNRLVIPLKYEYADDYYNKVAVVGMGVKRGVINTKGTLVVQMVYDNIEHCGKYLVVNKGEEWGVLDLSGKVVIPMKKRYYSNSISTGYFFKTIVGGFRFCEMLFDTNGKELLPEGCRIVNSINDPEVGFWYTTCGCFNMNTQKFETELTITKNVFLKSFVKVCDKEKHCGLMKIATGEIILPTEYDNIVAVNDIKKLIQVVKDGKTHYLNMDGSDAFEVKKECHDIFIITKDGKEGLLDAPTMEVLADCIYDEITVEVRSLYKLSKDGKQGLVDLYDLNNRRSRFSPNEDLKSHVSFVVPMDYDEIAIVRNVICYRKDGKWALGELSCPKTGFIFDDIPVEKSSFWLVKSNGKYGLYSEKLTEVWPCIYDEIQDEVAGYWNGGYGSRIAKKDGFYGVVRNNEVLLPFEYDEITKFKEFTRLCKNGKYDFISNWEEAATLEFQYEDVKYLNCEYRIGDHGYLFPAVKIKGKWGYLKVGNGKRERVTKPKFDEVGEFINRKALVREGKKTYYINLEGKRIR